MRIRVSAIESFEAGVHHPVMGVTNEELCSIGVPALVIPGNDKVHSSASGLAAHRGIPGAEFHRLPIEDLNVPLVPFPEWSPYEPEIVRVYDDFMEQVIAREAKSVS